MGLKKFKMHNLIYNEKKDLKKNIHKSKNPFLPEKTYLGGTKGKNLKKNFEKKNLMKEKIFLNIKNEYLDVF